ncbi:MAG: hypothetical protein KF789_04840 [Bdellovibrionaceae bacterium]|nr:hypothetical protein [Pseudobdellovibrionaceae bacterium]
MRTFIFVLTLLMGVTSAEATSRRVEAMRGATARLEQMKQSKGARDKATVLQETWDVLHLSAMSPEAVNPSDEFLHEFFTLTDTYMEVDNSGAAMDVFSDYYDKHRKAIDAYAKKKDRKTKYEIIERVLKAEKEYGTATDSETAEEEGPQKTTREPSMTR